VVKLAGYFTTFLGFLLGAFITYFSAQPQIQRQEFQIRTIQGELQASEKEKVAVGKELLDVATNIRRRGQSPEAYQAAETPPSYCNLLSPRRWNCHGVRLCHPRG
jgi:hypothetical protein